MGVARIPVGGYNQADIVGKMRDYHTPFLPLFYAEPAGGGIKGLRTATCTGGTQYKANGRSLYLSTSVGANKVYELGETELVPLSPTGVTLGGLWESYFYYAMTLNRTNDNLAATGEACQGFGIGSMGINTPWEGQLPAAGGIVLHVRWNQGRHKWELFGASNSDVGVAIPLSIQPLSTVDTYMQELALEWNPPETINVYCSGKLMHTVAFSKLFPLDQIPTPNAVQTVMFVTNGSNAAFGHSEAGFYRPRFYQPIAHPFQ